MNNVKITRRGFGRVLLGSFVAAVAPVAHIAGAGKVFDDLADDLIEPRVEVFVLDLSTIGYGSGPSFQPLSSSHVIP